MARLCKDVGVNSQPIISLLLKISPVFRSKHEFVRDCYLEVVETLLAATPANYEAILELDRKVRGKEIPAHLNRILDNPEDGPSLSAPEFMHTCMLGVARSIGLSSLFLVLEKIITNYFSVILSIVITIKLVKASIHTRY